MRRCLNNETPGSRPIPSKSSSKAESKNESIADIGSKVADTVSDSKLSRDVSDAKNDSVIAERGKSRGGTRGGKPNTATADTGLTGFGGVVPPPNLDSYIERCDSLETTTQMLLGEIITKPRLTEKLLSKPPFRFLHDIIMEVIKVTGFASDLFTPEEMDSAQVNEKNQKLQFLEKIIRLVGVQLNTLVEAKPIKIVAGSDPQVTNNFLQLLSVACKHMPDSRIAVKTVLSQMGLPENISTITTNNGNTNQFSVASNVDQEEAPRPLQRQLMADPKDDHITTRDDKKENSDNKAATTSEGEEGDNESKRSGRPMTARRRPPKVKDGAKEVVGKDAQQVVKRAEGILIDGQNDDDDEIIDETRLADEVKSDGKNNQKSDPQSKIVKDILSRQAEQELARSVGSNIVDNDESGPVNETNNKSGSGIRLGRLKKSGSEKKASSSQGSGAPIGEGDIERIRSSIQQLVQHTGPLGACMDYIQEDVGLMTTELHKWEDECRKYESIVEQERRKSREILHNLHREQSDVEDQINEQVTKVSSLKASIARNDEKIQQLLKLIATA